jgi:hypothetical protein
MRHTVRVLAAILASIGQAAASPGEVVLESRRVFETILVKAQCANTALFVSANRSVFWCAGDSALDAEIAGERGSDRIRCRAGQALQVFPNELRCEASAQRNPAGASLYSGGASLAVEIPRTVVNRLGGRRDDLAAARPDGALLALPGPWIRGGL